MKKINALVLLCAVVMFSCDCEEEEKEIQRQLNLQPSAEFGRDALFSKIVPNNNYATLEGLHLYSWTQSGVLNINRVALDFDLSTLPAGARIDRAELSLYFNNTSPYGTEHSGETDFVIQRITSRWEEFTITWNTQPTTTSTNEVHIPGATNPQQDFTSMDVTALVRDIVLDPDNSFGMALKFEVEEPYKVLLFASSDHPNAALRPRLDLFYTVQAD